MDNEVGTKTTLKIAQGTQTATCQQVPEEPYRNLERWSSETLRASQTAFSLSWKKTKQCRLAHKICACVSAKS